MANIWRRQPSRRLCVNNFIPDSATDASVLIAQEFFEAVVGGVIETIVAKEFPMLYLSKPVKAEQLVSKVEGATLAQVANEYPLIYIKSGKAKELRSRFS